MSKLVQCIPHGRLLKTAATLHSKYSQKLTFVFQVHKGSLSNKTNISSEFVTPCANGLRLQLSPPHLVPRMS